MSNPPILPSPRKDPLNGTKNGTPPESGTPVQRAPGFAAQFLGAFAAVFVLALVGGGIYLGWSYFRSSSASSAGSASGSPAKSPLQNVALWQEGPVMEGSLVEPVKPDIGWWTRTFSLPNITEQVSEFLSGQGLKVESIQPIHFTDTKDAEVLSYQVTVSVPGELYRVPQANWQAASPEIGRFTQLLVLNDGLPPGVYWNGGAAKVEAAANVQRTTLFNVRLNKTDNTVTADRLLPHDLVNLQEIRSYQTQTQQVIAALDQRLQQIDAQVQQDTQNRLAQVPADPPKPEHLTAHFGGDGSGEPTKSAARIGGGAAAGAAGGALFGSIAGNAGMGAGIGAAVGLLGGVIYNAESKSNDKEKLERQVADENAERMDAWRSEIKSLKQQRAQIQKDAVTEREQALNSLAQQITSNGGHLDGTAVPSNSPAPSTEQQATGPVQPMTSTAPTKPQVGDLAQLSADNAKDLATKRQLLGYWRSPQHDYCYSANGIIYMLGDATTTNTWDVKKGVYYADAKAFTIVSLTPQTFVVRSRGSNPTTYTVTRITEDQAGQ